VTEPTATAIIFLALSLLLGISALFSRASQRIGVPVVLVFLVIGMLAGSEGIARIPFDDYAFAFRIGSASLVLILFDAGLNTPRSVFTSALAPAATLATAGVAGTAALVAVAAHLFGMSWPAAWLLGAVVSSTDAAAVFSVLRSSGIQLKMRVGATLEIESGLNDPMAVLLTTVLTQNLLHPGGAGGWKLALAPLSGPPVEETLISARLEHPIYPQLKLSAPGHVCVYAIESWRNFTATVLPIAVAVARYTTPMPPAPRGSSIW